MSTGSSSCRVLVIALVIAAGAGAMLPACVGLQLPGTQSVLLGRWKLEQASDDQLSETFWTFDALGRLVEIEIVTEDVTIEQTIRSSTTTIEGDEVTIQTGTAGNNWSFTGTLNEEENVITGKLTTTFSFLGITVNIDNGDATLTKQ